MTRRLHAASIVVTNFAKRLIGTEGAASVEDAAQNRDTRGQTIKRLRYGVNPSRPGEPPHKQTGRLQSSVTREVDDQRARVGTNVVYGRYLELGTRKMAPRPWLRRSLDENRDKVRSILSRPLRLPNE